MDVVEILHRYCRTRECLYVETGWLRGTPVYCFEDYKGKRFYLSADEIRANLILSSDAAIAK